MNEIHSLPEKAIGANPFEGLLEQRSNEIASLHRELEALSHAISHDMRAPLRAIDGLSKILLENYAPDLPAEARHLLERVGVNSSHMARLIEALLDYLRISSQPLGRVTLPAADVVRSALLNLAEERAGRTVDINIDPLPSCQADPELLERVFSTLLANSLKFTRSRQSACIAVGAVQVAHLPPHRFEQSVDSSTSAFFVRDNGIGFNMQHAENLFGLFQRFHPVGEFEGAGIGLAIAQRIVQRHGGVIWAEAAPGLGATFCFTLGTTSAQHDI